MIWGEIYTVLLIITLCVFCVLAIIDVYHAPSMQRVRHRNTQRVGHVVSEVRRKEGDVWVIFCTVRWVVTELTSDVHINELEFL
jgi:hypothetical protein